MRESIGLSESNLKESQSHFSERYWLISSRHGNQLNDTSSTVWPHFSRCLAGFFISYSHSSKSISHDSTLVDHMITWSKKVGRKTCYWKIPTAMLSSLESKFNAEDDYVDKNRKIMCTRHMYQIKKNKKCTQ